MSRFQVLLLKIAALLSACGGPLVVMDATKQILGDPFNFVVGFAPVGCAVLGTFPMASGEHDLPGRLFAWMGLLGILVVGAMNVFGTVEVIRSPDRADRGLIIVGIFVGTAALALYLLAFRRWRGQGLRSDAPLDERSHGA